MRSGLFQRELMKPNDGEAPGGASSGAPEGAAPEVVKYMQNQREMWDEQQAALKQQAAEAESRANQLEGYKKLFDAMSLDPDYGRVLQGFMRGEDYKAAPGSSSGSGDKDTDTYWDDGPQAPSSNLSMKDVERLLDEKLNSHRQELIPFAKQLHKMNVDREVEALITEFGPEARKHFAGIDRRIQEAKGNLGVRDAYLLEALDEIRARDRQRAEQDGMKKAQFQTVEAPSSGAGSESEGRYQNEINSALKKGDFRAATAKAFQQAMEEHGGLD